MALTRFVTMCDISVAMRRGARTCIFKDMRCLALIVAANKSYAFSFAATISFTALGLALPPVAFIT